MLSATFLALAALAAPSSPGPWLSPSRPLIASPVAMHGGGFVPPVGRPSNLPPVRPPGTPTGLSSPLTPGGVPAAPPGGSGGSTARAPGGNPIAPTTPGSSAATDVLDWSKWWNLERDALLRFRDRIRAKAAVSGGGLGAVGGPTDEDVERWVFPVMLQVLASEQDPDMITAALVAASRMGSRIGPVGRDALHGAIRRHLRSRNQEISETATLALGILADDGAVEPLLAILAGDRDGAALVGRGGVSARTRAFAAFALGLAARHHPAPHERQRIAAALLEALDDDHAHDEVPTAAIIALGLCPVPHDLTVPAEELRTSRIVDGVVSRAGQIAWIQRWSLGEGSRGISGSRHSLSHAQVALARLSRGANEATRAGVVQHLVDVSKSRKEPLAVRAGALIALGEVVRCGSGASDAAARDVLLEAMRRGQPLERRLASIALARAASRPGGGEVPLAGVESARKALVQQLLRGRSGEDTWASLALGLQALRLGRLRQGGADSVGAPLLDRLRRERSAGDVGAFAVGVALTYANSDAKARKRAATGVGFVFERSRDPGARGHLAIALGVLGDEDSREELRKVLRSSRFQPELHWSVAVALGLLGDSRVTGSLVDTLQRAKSGMARAAAASALGTVGDRSSLGPLVELVTDEQENDPARAFGIVGLGILCDDDPLPWRSPVAEALPFFAVTETLTGSANGLLDIL